jgi:hypothetical protein
MILGIRIYRDEEASSASIVPCISINCWSRNDDDFIVA